MEVIPAIDVWGGKLARFTSSGPQPLDLFGGDPLAAAEVAVGSGARWLHVVDMGLAYTGKLAVQRIIDKVVSAGVHVESSGGIWRGSDVEELLRAGAARVVLGSRSLGDRGSLADLVDRFGDDIAIGVEAEGETIRPRGSPDVNLPLGETLTWLAEARVPRLVVTNVPGVGERIGPDMALVSRSIATGIPVIASGGIASLADLEQLRTAGVEGAIVGRSWLDGSLDLKLSLTRFS